MIVSGRARDVTENGLLWGGPKEDGAEEEPKVEVKK